MLKERIINTLCAIGRAFSHAVGNTPEALKEMREVGMDSISRQRREDLAEDRRDHWPGRAPR